jgi:peptidoglycan/xylan/chitin deacetylase (PgdA/CDA1 family)
MPVADPTERPWAVSIEAFENQIDRLAASGRVAVSMAQAHDALVAGRGVPRSWVALTFDDGNESDHAHALPVLARHGFAASFFVCGNRVGARGGLEPAMIRAMSDAGMHIGSHAMTHRFLTTLSARDEEDELVRSKEILQGIVGTPVDHFAPPGGRWSKRTAATLRRLSYHAVSSSAFGYNDARAPKFAYRRIPIVEATAPAYFDAIVAGARWRLVSGYVRAGSVGLVRRALGETAYARLRGHPSE